MKTDIVVGCTFGDEGKGQVVHALCNDYLKESLNPIVVRFSGGHQAGHTVTTSQGPKHVFSCFGSGTFAGCSTYWGEPCVMDPYQWLIEKEELNKLGIDIPSQIFHPYVKITTPFDVLINMKDRLGSTVGKGVWETIERNRNGLHLFVKDLRFPQVVKTKLQLIKEYSEKKITEKGQTMPSDIDIDVAVKYYQDFYNQIIVQKSLKEYTNYIYEGSQGILLDPKYGFSHKYTTPISCCPSWDFLPLSLEDEDLTINYVFRSYLTRHGMGPVADSVENHFRNPYETNVYNEFQGDFKTYEFNEELVLYGIDCVEVALNCEYCKLVKTRLIETCCDINKDHTIDFPSTYSVKTYQPDFETLHGNH